jgi:hypothetical protein
VFRWTDLPDAVLRIAIRLYGFLFLGGGLLFLYWSGRGFLAYQAGVRAAWAEPLAIAAGIGAGFLSLWVGLKILRKGPSAKFFLSSRPSELDETLEEAMKLDRTDPEAARQLLDSYFMREAANTERRRHELREKAPFDAQAALALRKELQEELVGNAAAKEDLLKSAPENDRASMLSVIEASERQLRAELLELEATIQRGMIR